MVVVKYKKIEEGMFFSHLNILRLFNRLLSIGGVSVKYSEGFNKTRRIYFSSPTRVGVESECEYLIIDTEEKAKDVEYKLENIMPSWLQLVKVFAVDGKLNVASLNTAAKYVIDFDEYKSSKSKIKEFFEKENIILPVIQHGVEKQVDVKSRIFNYNIGEENMVITAGVGNESVRIDELVKELLAFLGKSKNYYTIRKLELYTTDSDGSLLSIDKKAEETIKSE